MSQYNRSRIDRWRNAMSGQASHDDSEMARPPSEPSDAGPSEPEGFDPEVPDSYADLLGTTETSSPLLCRFSYLNCHHEPFTEPGRWVQHMLFHFQAAGPPLEGATCRYCDYKPTSEDLKHPDVVKVLQAHGEMPEGDWPLNATDLAVAQYRFGKAKRPDQYPYQTDARVSTQAKALWYLLHKHVLEHHAGEASSKSTAVDTKMTWYFYSIRVIAQHELKTLEQGGTVGVGEGAYSVLGNSREGSRRDKRLFPQAAS